MNLTIKYEERVDGDLAATRKPPMTGHAYQCVTPVAQGASHVNRFTFAMDGRATAAERSMGHRKSIDFFSLFTTRHRQSRKSFARVCALYWFLLKQIPTHWNRVEPNGFWNASHTLPGALRHRCH